MTNFRRGESILSILVCVVLCFSFFLKDAQAQQSADERIQILEDRLKALEKGQLDSKIHAMESKRSVYSYFNTNLLLGGFFEGAMTHIDGPDTESQTSANFFFMGLNLSTEFDDNMRFVSQFLTGTAFPLRNPHNDPRGSPDRREFSGSVIGSLVSQAYVEYTFSEAFNIQGGIGYVPYGYAFQQREFVLFKRRLGPQLINSSTATSVGIASPLWMGLHMHGRFESDLGYNFYTFTPSSTPNNLGMGTRLWWDPAPNTSFGASFQTAEEDNKSYYSGGADIRWELNQFGVVTEYAQNQRAGGRTIAVSYYIEPYYTFSDRKYLIFAVADYLNSEVNTTATAGATLSDPFKKTIYGIGLNWLPLAYTRIRFAFLRHDYENETVLGQNRQYDSADLSVGIAF